MTEETRKINLTVNGTEHQLEITPDTKLADVLRHDLGLTGTKIGCGDGQCGSCVVLLDGRAVRSCTYPARRADGKEVLTVEGLAASPGATPTSCTPCKGPSSTTARSSAAFARPAC